MKSLTNLAHEEDGVKDDEQHDEVLKGRGGDQPPDMVASSHLGLGDVDFLRSYRHHVRYTRFLRIELRIIIFVFSNKACLIFVNIVRQFCFPQFIECDDDEGDKNVDKEKWKDNKVDNVVDGHFRSEPRDGALIFKCRRH